MIPAKVACENSIWQKNVKMPYYTVFFVVNMFGKGWEAVQPLVVWMPTCREWSMVACHLGMYHAVQIQ